MGFRRKRENVQKEKRWRAFCVASGELMQQSGLPPSLYATEEEFAVFLIHGHTHPNSPISFSISELSPKQYRALYELIDRYFEAGYEADLSGFVALKQEEVKKLAQKYPDKLN